MVVVLFEVAHELYTYVINIITKPGQDCFRLRVVSNGLLCLLLFLYHLLSFAGGGCRIKLSE